MPWPSGSRLFQSFDVASGRLAASATEVVELRRRAHRGELGAESSQRLRANLRDARLADAEHVGDVGRLELLEVVQREHGPLLVVQAEDRFAEHHDLALAQQ